MPGGKKPIPRGTPKDQRQYEEIKKSELKQGRPTEDAKRIAAATVNKHRSSEGRTKKSK
jgi:hypothetical protein